MPKRSPNPLSSPTLKSNLVGVRVGKAELEWLAAEGRKRKKAGATLRESSAVNIVRDIIKGQMSLFNLPVDFAEMIQREMQDQGLSLEQFIRQRLSDYAVQRKLEAEAAATTPSR